MRAIRVTGQEAMEESEINSLSHRLVNDVAKVELRVFDGGVQRINSNLEVPVHESEDRESVELAEYMLAFKSRLNA